MDLHLFMSNTAYAYSFARFAQKNFGAADNVHFFLNKNEFPHLPQPQGIDLRFLPVTDEANRALVHREMERASRIFLHGLFEPTLSVIKEYSGTKPVIWVIWGGDFRPYITHNRHELFDRQTFALYSLRKRFFLAVRAGLRRLKIIDWPPRLPEKISHVLTSSSFYDDRLGKVLSGPFEILRFWYYNPVDFNLFDTAGLPDRAEHRFKPRFSKVIMLGNAAAKECNHLGLLDKLATIPRDDFCVVAPLSYGSRRLAKLVAARGDELLGERFIPLLEFMPPEQYAAILRQVDVFLHNSYFSKGMGTMYALLYLGRTVIINRKNLQISTIMRERGFTFREEDLDDPAAPWLASILEDPAQEAAEANRRVALEMLGEERVAAMYRVVLEKTLSHSQEEQGGSLCAKQ